MNVRIGKFQAPDVADTILLADDDEINRAILGNIFSSSFLIQEATNGKEALELILRHRDRICAVLLDVVMPVMNGLELLKKLHLLGLTEQIPVFLITSEYDNNTLWKAYSMGSMDVIQKPVIPFIVQRRINSVIELFQARKQLAETVDAQQNELYRQEQRIADLNEGMIEALSTAIEFRDGESGEHVRRIREITVRMLSETDLGSGLSQEDIRQIGLAAVMHDVGKIAIPDAILNKPGKLTSEEFEVMKTHTLEGALLLDQIPQMKRHTAFKYAQDITRHHHERWDGGGYPDGLRGKQIPIWTQVVSISDVYDALISKRVYKSAYSIDTALDMIKNGACGTFNPDLLRNFLSIEKNFRPIYGKGLAAI